MRFSAFGFVRWALILLSPLSAQAADSDRGRLLVIGGGLRPDNVAVYDRLLTHAGGRDKARIGILTMAGTSVQPGVQLSLTLRKMGVAEDRVRLVDLSLENSARNAFDPAVVAEIRSCTGLYFTGGDQRRIVNSLVDADGAERPALAAVRAVLADGGVVAGSSAGAAMQGNPMLTVSGLPDDMLDEGMDALDFGLTSNPRRRGLSVTRGLGLFRGGLVDQHFNQFRGRLSRLARAATETRTRYGFGVDENTAMDVGPDGTIEVVGAGCVTVVDTQDAACKDGPHGCVLTGVRLSSLADGDRFDPKTGAATPAAGKVEIAKGKELNNGNLLITDVAAEGAAHTGLTLGLGDNTRRRQVGITLRYAGTYGHGYRFTFTKTDETRSFAGYVGRVWCYSILNAQLDVEPIVSNLLPSAQAIPVDLPAEASLKTSCEAAAFRGILLQDGSRNFRPADPMTRGELASAIVRTMHLEFPRRDAPKVTDVPSSSPLGDDVEKVVTAGLMSLDASGAFHPEAPIARQDAASVLVKLSEAFHGNRLPDEALDLEDGERLPASQRGAVFTAVRAGILTAEKNRFRPEASFTRAEAASALCRIVGFSWQEAEKPGVR